MEVNGRLPAEPWETERSFADFLRAIACAQEPGKESEGAERYLKARYDSSVSKVALTAASGALGGYLVPRDFLPGIWGVVEEYSVFLREGFRVNMASRETQVPVIRLASGASGVTPFFGGLQFKWTEEAATRDETEPTFGSVLLVAHELQGYAKVSNALLDDGNYGMLADHLTRLFGQAAAWYLDYACFSGNGVGKPLGIIHAPCAIVIDRATNTDFLVADVGAMMEKLFPGSWATACWSMHPTVLPKVVKLSDTAGGAFALNQPQKERGQFHFGGCPLYLTEKVPALGTRGDVCFFDPNLYAVGVRPEIEIALSRHEPTAYLANQSIFRVTLRADGQPLPHAAVTLADGTATASSVVVLDT